MQSIDSIETYANGMNKDLVNEKEKIKCNNMIKWYKKWLTLMLLRKIIKEHNPNWPQIPDNLYKILITGASGSRKANSLFI